MTKISKDKRSHLLALCGVLVSLEANRARQRMLDAELRALRRFRAKGWGVLPAGASFETISLDSTGASFAVFKQTIDDATRDVAMAILGVSP